MTAPPPSPTPSLLRAALLRGVFVSLPFLIIVVPFGVVFGVAAAAAGMGLIETMGFSVIVIAGAAQFAALQLIQDGAPLFIVILTALAVNLRLAMYSAALTPHLGATPPTVRACLAYCLMDQSFVASMVEYQRRPASPPAEKAAFFFGVALPLCPFWYVATWLGVTFGKAIPPEYALDFAVPICFLATVAPMLRGRANLAAAAVSVGVTLALWWMPYSSGLLVAGVAAMMTGAAVETLTEKRKVA
ncbi:Predicted branched-chain amino acid permease (azaleucine resistance) [Gemmobacter aquatilis]|uniref:Predicted branched-chain amino acid permease (Azaleucine resistance) n=1 Tax=Gemmobacter aquatilis TaxID=933059 RepID=A0A1H7ZFP5_9RHOB|nr:AzlC family ABC transporter permease [Gemmobacter aquatilis]SEM56267.1 Predicted branched-chain amino acid permease (azaleucine resistance) [Gemmobacter aquatilis]